MCKDLKKSVLIGMSGGVDSSVAAALLLQQGYNVTGITFQLCSNAGNASEDAARVAKVLGIRHETVDFSELFHTHVLNYFVSEYQNGRTPNPCVVCNRTIKFGRFLELADELGADLIATGHYARIIKDEENGFYHLCASNAKNKDQSYFLYNMTQQQLSRTLMPLFDMDKQKTRTLAKQFGLPVAHKPDSQDICFIPNGNYLQFLKDFAHLEDKKGLFRSKDGEILGEHNGVAHFTIGQRKGLGVTFGKPMFVIGLDAKTNTVYLGEKGSEFMQEFTAANLHLIIPNTLKAPRTLHCKIRYAAPLAQCTVTPLDQCRIRVQMQEPARAVTPGQSVVFYEGEKVFGGAVIESMY